jgi:hypothetical protein
VHPDPEIICSPDKHREIRNIEPVIPYHVKNRKAIQPPCDGCDPIVEPGALYRCGCRHLIFSVVGFVFGFIEIKFV